MPASSFICLLLRCYLMWLSCSEFAITLSIHGTKRAGLTCGQGVPARVPLPPGRRPAARQTGFQLSLAPATAAIRVQLLPPQKLSQVAASRFASEERSPANRLRQAHSNWAVCCCQCRLQVPNLSKAPLHPLQASAAPPLRYRRRFVTRFAAAGGRVGRPPGISGWLGSNVAAIGMALYII